MQANIILLSKRYQVSNINSSFLLLNVQGLHYTSTPNLSLTAQSIAIWPAITKMTTWLKKYAKMPNNYLI